MPLNNRAGDMLDIAIDTILIYRTNRHQEWQQRSQTATWYTVKVLL